MIEANLPALKTAAETFRNEFASLQPRWDTVDTAEQVEELQTEEKAAADKLRIAFYEVTSDINRLDGCMSVDTFFILQFAERHAGLEEE